MKIHKYKRINCLYYNTYKILFITQHKKITSTKKMLVPLQKFLKREIQTQILSEPFTKFSLQFINIHIHTHKTDKSY